MRVVFLTALILGWPVFIRSFSPDVVLLTYGSLGAALGIIVGYRRRGRIVARIRATLFFAACATVLAWISAIAAMISQTPPVPDTYSGPLGGADDPIFVCCAVLLLPLMATIVVLMYRSWMWSVNSAIGDAPNKPSPATPSLREGQTPG